KPTSNGRARVNPLPATILATLLASLLAPLSTAYAQGTGTQPAAAELPQTPTRFHLALHLGVSDPKEEFRDNVGTGVGLGAAILYDLDRRGVLSLRLDGSWAAYGRESKRVPLSNTVGGRILVDVVTTNSLYTFGLGLQAAAPSGAIRPYGGVS